MFPCPDVTVGSLHLNTLLLRTFHTNCDNVRGKNSDTLVFPSVMQFIALGRDILVAIIVLPLNMTFTYCLYH